MFYRTIKLWWDEKYLGETFGTIPIGLTVRSNEQNKFEWVDYKTLQEKVLNFFLWLDEIEVFQSFMEYSQLLEQFELFLLIFNSMEKKNLWSSNIYKLG